MNKEVMMKQMQNLLGLQKQPTVKEMLESQEKEKQAAKTTGDTTGDLVTAVSDLAEMFCDCAVVLSCIAELLMDEENPGQLNPYEDLYEEDDWEDDMDEDADYACCCDDCELRDECDSYYEENDSYSPTVIYAVPGRPIELMSEVEAANHFPWKNDEQDYVCFSINEHLQLLYMEPAWEDAEEITILDPVYIARLNEARTDSEEITVRDMVDAVMFLEDHMVSITDESGRTSTGYWLPKKKKED